MRDDNLVYQNHAMWLLQSIITASAFALCSITRMNGKPGKINKVLFQESFLALSLFIVFSDKNLDKGSSLWTTETKAGIHQQHFGKCVDLTVPSPQREKTALLFSVQALSLIR